MGKKVQKIGKLAVNALFRDKIHGNKIGYYYVLLGISTFPVLIVMTSWIIIEYIVEGKITDSLVDNIASLLFIISSFTALRMGMFIGRELDKKEGSHKIMTEIMNQLKKESVSEDCKEKY